MALTLPAGVNPPGDPKSRQAATMFEELMELPAEDRRLLLEELTGDEAREVYAAAYRVAGTSYALWRDDPVGFVEQVLGAAVWSVPRRFMTALTEHKQVAVPSCFGSSKCVYGRDVIMLADGSVVRAESLVGSEFEMIGWQEDGTQTIRRARAEWNTVEPVYRVTTDWGREIVRNGHHPLYAADNVRRVRSGGQVGTIIRTPENIGWRAINDLKPGDLVLVPEEVRPKATRRMPFEEAALLGYLLGDGGTSAGFVTFSHLPGEALDEFISCAEKLGSRIVDLQVREGRRHREIAVRGYRQPGRQYPVNPVLNLARSWGLIGCKATEKRFPDIVWQLHPDDLAVILSRLWACDGWATSGRTKNRPNNSAIGISLSNEGLIRDIQRAMLRLGVCGKVSKTYSSLNGKRFPYWAFLVTSARDMRRMVEVLDVPEKREAMKAALAAAEKRRHSELWRHRNAPAGYRWEKVKDVERLPDDERTVAIEVDVDHTWVDLFVEHNTFSCGQMVLWASLVHPVGTALVVTLAPLWRQVARQLWPEVRAAHTRAGLPGVVDMTQYKLPDANGVDTTVAYGIAAAPHNEAAVQGIHKAELLLIVEEAGGIATTIGDNLAGLLVGEGARMIAIGNPPTDQVNTWFEKLCRDPEVETIPISAYDTPNLTGEYFGECQSCPAGGHSPAKHMVDREWIERTIRVHGPKSNYVRAKIDAKFPKGLTNVVIPAEWVEAAVEMEEPELRPGWARLRDLGLADEDGAWVVQAGAWVRLGVDVASDGGDELVVARLVGDLATVEHASSGPENADPVAVAGLILKEIRRAEALAAAIGSSDPVRVKIDGNGLGWGVAGLLAAWGREGEHGAEIVPVLVSESPGREPDEATLRPFLKRDEMWLATRALVRPDEHGNTRLRLRVDDMTSGQLAAPKLFTRSSGHSQVESKKEMRKRGVSSPDRGEAVLLSVYEPEEEDSWRVIA
ncbi:LAGLIDADG family homing endonuclease [Nonomuraea candida]|uniref:LAGLIDADG family homing endonuclease n=1 Tax=Nonomuraea candida TaxID=359159 RepID=UPI0014702358|nr:LAGLIDADG family homing endonuclease [Nonomuraea candida]